MGDGTLRPDGAPVVLGPKPGTERFRSWPDDWGAPKWLMAAAAAICEAERPFEEAWGNEGSKKPCECCLGRCPMLAWTEVMALCPRTLPESMEPPRGAGLEKFCRLAELAEGAGPLEVAGRPVG